MMDDFSFNNLQLEYIAKNIDLQESISKTSNEDKLTKSAFDEMLDEASMSNLDEAEKKLFYSILEDGYITTAEAQTLTYEQTKKIKEFILEKDKNGEYLEASFINASYKANSLMFSSMVSDDENFNKAFFNVLKGLTDTEDILKFMTTIAGVSDPTSIVGFDEYLNTEKGYNQLKVKDMSAFLENNIKLLKEKLDNSSELDTNEFYKEILGFYNSLEENYTIEKESTHLSLSQIIKTNRPNILEVLRLKENEK